MMRHLCRNHTLLALTALLAVGCSEPNAGADSGSERSLDDCTFDLSVNPDGAVETAQLPEACPRTQAAITEAIELSDGELRLTESLLIGLIPFADLVDRCALARRLADKVESVSDSHEVARPLEQAILESLRGTPIDAAVRAQGRRITGISVEIVQIRSVKADDCAAPLGKEPYQALLYIGLDPPPGARRQ
jgi:hypothetical protein